MRLKFTLALCAVIGWPTLAAPPTGNFFPAPEGGKERILELRAAEFRRQVQDAEVRWISRGLPGTPMPNLRPPVRKGIHLSTGEWIGGKLEGMDAENGVRWRHPAIKEAMQIRPDQITSIIFPRGPLPKDLRHHATRAVLANGDVLLGDFLGLKKGKLVLDTWYAGKLEMDASQITQLIPGLNQKIILQGPLKASNWKSETLFAEQILKPEKGALPKEILKRIYDLNNSPAPKGKAGWRSRMAA